MNQMNDKSAQLLVQCLQENYEAAVLLHNILLEEQACLRLKNQAQLQPILEKKGILLNDIQQKEITLIKLCQQHKVSFTAVGIRKFIDASPAHFKTAIKNQWKNLEDRLKECDHLNRVNGKVLTRIQTNLRSLLNTLKGNDTTTQLYQANGISENHSAGRLLTKA